MKEHVFSDRPYSDLAYFLVALSLIELEITRVSGVDDDTLRVFVYRAPVVQGRQQLLAQVLTELLALIFRI